MANVQKLTDDDFKTTLQAASTPVLVDFSTTWCGPCKALAPKIETVAQEYDGKLAVYAVDAEEAAETAMAFSISSVPTCIFFKEGEEVGRFMGNQDLNSIKKHIDRVVTA